MDFVFHLAGRESFSMKSLFAICVIICVAAQGTDALNFGESSFKCTYLGKLLLIISCLYSSAEITIIKHRTVPNDKLRTRALMKGGNGGHYGNVKGRGFGRRAPRKFAENHPLYFSFKCGQCPFFIPEFYW